MTSVVAVGADVSAPSRYNACHAAPAAWEALTVE
jgi:hypothetical protein